jgi:hypothetical protein
MARFGGVKIIVSEAVLRELALEIAVTVTLTSPLTFGGAWYITLVVVWATNSPCPAKVQRTPRWDMSLESVAEMGNALPGSRVWAEFGINCTETLDVLSQARENREIASRQIERQRWTKRFVNECWGLIFAWPGFRLHQAAEFASQWLAASGGYQY